MSATQHTSGSTIARALLAAMSDKDFVTFKALLAPDVEYLILPASLGRPPTVGPEATAGGFEKLCQYIPDFSVRKHALVFIPCGLTSFVGRHQRHYRGRGQGLGLRTCTSRSGTDKILGSDWSIGPRSRQVNMSACLTLSVTRTGLCESSASASSSTVTSQPPSSAGRRPERGIAK
jgi:hypothetical protein